MPTWSTPPTVWMSADNCQRGCPGEKLQFETHDHLPEKFRRQVGIDPRRAKGTGPLFYSLSQEVIQTQPRPAKIAPERRRTGCRHCHLTRCCESAAADGRRNGLEIQRA